MEQIGNICISALIITLPALFLTILLFRGMIIRRLSQDNFTGNLQFADTQLVITPAEPLRRTILLGSALYVPQGVNAILEKSTTIIPKPYLPGEHIITELRTAVLYYKYVDMTLRNNIILVGDAPTKDGFNVSLWIKLSFRVTDAVEVANKDEPVLELIMLVENAVRRATLDYNHDEIIPTPPQSPVGNLVLANYIRYILQTMVSPTSGGANDEIQIVKGINLHSIGIHSRIEDPNRKDYPKGPSEAEQAVNEAENRKEVAGIDNEIRLEHAKTILEEDEILDPVLERELDRVLRREKPRLDIERERVRVQEQMAALNLAILIFAQILRSPSCNRMFYSRSLNRFRKMFEELFESVLREPDVISAEYCKESRTPENAREKLNYQLNELWGVEGYVEHRLRELSNASLGLVIFIHKKLAVFIFDVSGTDPIITRIILRSSKGLVCIVPNPGLYNSFTLPEVIERLNQRYHPERNKSGDEDDCASWD